MDVISQATRRGCRKKPIAAIVLPFGKPVLGPRRAGCGRARSRRGPAPGRRRPPAAGGRRGASESSRPRCACSETALRRDPQPRAVRASSCLDARSLTLGLTGDLASNAGTIPGAGAERFSALLPASIAWWGAVL